MSIKRIFSEFKNQEVAVQETADYLFHELNRGETFVISETAYDLQASFLKALKQKKTTTSFRESIESLKSQPSTQFRIAQEWLLAHVMESDQAELESVIPEAAILLLGGKGSDFQKIDASTKVAIAELQGEHNKIQAGNYQLDYPEFIGKVKSYKQEVVPRFRRFHQLKRDLSKKYRQELHLESFKPKVMSSFVRNKLIDQVYLPMIGDNLAKQIGTSGENTRTDRMGLLLLLSPPGYGKTTLMEYIANRLGLIFMKIDGPTIGHRVTSLDPADAPNRAARQELKKLNLAFEMGDNIMIYIDDIQHCHSEFLQKFISLCDGQRKIEGVWKGESRSYDFRSKRVAVVMAGNPYTESGERFQVPDMLANRADIYNLGDIIGGQEEVFTLSYLENALTSNPVLARLAGKSMQDVYTLIKQARHQEKGSLDLEGNHSPSDLKDYLSVLEKMLRVQEVILKVNRAYIQSAAIADADRTEPPFKLQGSYRNMNKLAEKVVPIMNAEELETLILSHYEGELQTLTSGAEANQLMLHGLMGIQTEAEQERWGEICGNFFKKKI